MHLRSVLACLYCWHQTWCPPVRLYVAAPVLTCLGSSVIPVPAFPDLFHTRCVVVPELGRTQAAALERQQQQHEAALKQQAELFKQLLEQQQRHYEAELDMLLKIRYRI